MMEKHLPFNMEVHCREAQIRNDLIAIRSDLIFYCHTSIRKLPNANQYLMSTISIWSVWFVICPVLYKVILLIRGNNLAYTCGRDVRNQYKSQIRVICHRVLRNDWKWCDILQKKILQFVHIWCQSRCHFPIFWLVVMTNTLCSDWPMFMNNTVHKTRTTK